MYVMLLPFSLAAPPPEDLAASKAVPLTVNIFMLSIHLQVMTALPEKIIRAIMTMVLNVFMDRY